MPRCPTGRGPPGFVLIAVANARGPPGIGRSRGRLWLTGRPVRVVLAGGIRLARGEGIPRRRPGRAHIARRVPTAHIHCLTHYQRHRRPLVRAGAPG